MEDMSAMSVVCCGYMSTVLRLLHLPPPTPPPPPDRAKTRRSIIDMSFTSCEKFPQTHNKPYLTSSPINPLLSSLLFFSYLIVLATTTTTTTTRTRNSAQLYPPPCAVNLLCTPDISVCLRFLSVTLHFFLGFRSSTLGGAECRHCIAC